MSERGEDGGDPGTGKPPAAAHISDMLGRWGAALRRRDDLVGLREGLLAAGAVDSIRELDRLIAEAEAELARLQAELIGVSGS